MKLSIILPIYNEEENLKILLDEILKVVSSLDYKYEIIAVNDGSNDNSFNILKKIAAKNNSIKIISFTRNFG